MIELVVDNKDFEPGKVLQFATDAPGLRRSECMHQRFIISSGQGTVHCADCHEAVSAFHALEVVTRIDGELRRSWKRWQDDIAALKAWSPHLRAVKELERVWRGRLYPLCPHCKQAVSAPDLARTGVTSIPPTSKGDGR